MKLILIAALGTVTYVLYIFSTKEYEGKYTQKVIFSVCDKNLYNKISIFPKSVFYLK